MAISWSAASLLIMLVAYGARFSFGVFFKPMLDEFDWSRGLTSGAFTLSMVTQGFFGIIMGRLNDRFGPRLAITVCCFFLGLGFLLMSQTSYSWQFYLFYGVIIGIGMGGVFVALISTVTRWFIKNRGAMTGVVMAGLGLGSFIAPPLSDWLISIYHWRLSYIIVGGTVLVIGVLAAQFLKRDPTKMGLMPYGEDKGGEHKSASGVEGLSLKEAAHTRQFWVSLVIFACLGYSIWAISIHLDPHVTDLGISATTAAHILAVMGGIQVIGGISMGGAADRFGSRWAMAIGFTLIAAAVFWLVTITEVWALYLFAVIFGLGVGGGGILTSIVVAELFGIKSHGFIFGVNAFCFSLGGALGPLLTGYVFDVTGNYQVAFIICGAIGFSVLYYRQP